MPTWIAIEVYRCEVAGKPSPSLDFVARRVTGETIEAVEASLFAEPNVVYENEHNEKVEWILSSVPSIQEEGSNPNDDELAGFIAELPEIEKWSQPSA
ncbi:MAG: hypothetical protein WCK63_15575 [Betaproteobacteria bacterium]